MKSLGKISDLIIKYFYIPLTLLFVVGGLGVDSVWVSWSGMFIFSLLLLLLVIQKGKLLFPSNFFVLGVVIGFQIINLFITGNLEESLKYLFLFIGGAALWLFIYNLEAKLEVSKKFVWILAILALFFGQYVLIELTRGVEGIKSFAIIGYSSLGRNHHHIGDFFAIIGVVAFYNALMNQKRRMVWVITGFASLGFIVFSQSRSALVAFGVVSFVLLWQKGYLEKYKKFAFAFFLSLGLLVMYFAQYKSLLFSRVYFIQGLMGFVNNPWGVGMGNFSVISNDPRNKLFGLDSFSTVAHNLPLEFLTGMGFVGLVFLYFYARTLMDAVKNIKINPIASLVFITLSVNFFFDFTYTIPTMLWIWFISLGLMQVDKKVS